MATFFKDGIISKGGVNQGKSVPTGVKAPGQNKDSGNAPDWLSGVPSDIKDIGQKIFDGVSGGAKDFAAGLRGKNLPGKAGTQIASSEASFSSSVENKDWRVKISVPQVIKNQNSPDKLTNKKHVFFPKKKKTNVPKDCYRVSPDWFSSISRFTG